MGSEFLERKSETRGKGGDLDARSLEAADGESGSIEAAAIFWLRGAHAAARNPRAYGAPLILGNLSGPQEYRRSNRGPTQPQRCRVPKAETSAAGGIPCVEGYRR